jgi:Ca2+-binding RTX toxin-like protein
LDTSGAAYLSGLTASSEASFPDGDGFGPLTGPDTSFNGGGVNGFPVDAFVAKITSSGTSLAYAGYIGGSGDDSGAEIAVDGTGAAFIVGRTDSTESTFPDGDGFGALPSVDATYNGGFNDAFVAKVSSSGAALAYAGYIGGSPAKVGSGDDWGLGVDVDISGAAYVSGSTTSAEKTFPDGDGFGGVATFDGSYNGGYDGFVAKVAPPGTSLAYLGFIGGRGQRCCTGDFEPAQRIAVDASGAAYVVGYTSSDERTFPDGDGFGDVLSNDRSFNGGVKPVPNDAFVMKLVPAGTSPLFAGYVGGSGADCDGKKGPELASLIGTSGRDSVVGTARRDIIATLDGQDRIKGRAGRDFVCAGRGWDKINGGSGDDRLEGEAGADLLRGAGGDDLLKGGKGKDRCAGGAGRDKALRCERMNLGSIGR